MKKGKVLGKGQIAVGIMILALGAAVWLNTKYLPSGTKYLGEASYVNGSSEQEAVQTSAGVSQSDYFKETKKQRQKDREEACATVEEALKSDKLTEADKKDALAKVQQIASRIEQESNIETVLSAKGFDNVLAVIGDKGINIIVKTKSLTSAETLQIQDVVTSQTNIAVADIKIVPIT